MIDNDAAGQEREVDLSLVRVGSILLRNRRLIVGSSVAMAVLFAVGTWMQPDSYTAESIFVPQARTAGSGSELGLLASQFGFEVGSGPRPAESPQFYAALISTKGILRGVAQEKYSMEHDNSNTIVDAAPLSALLGIEADDSVAALRETVGQLQEMVSATVDQTGRVRVRSQASSPQLAVALNERILDAVVRYNRDVRQSNTRAERLFIEERMAEAKRDLEIAEAAYTEFLTTNRVIQGAPQLMAEASRLDRQAQFRQQVFTSLAQANEKARVDEVRNTPLISMVERPQDTVSRTPDNMLLNGVFAAFITALIMAGFAFVREYVRRQRVERPDTYHEFMALSKEARADLGAPWKAFRRGSGQPHATGEAGMRSRDQTLL